MTDASVYLCAQHMAAPDLLAALRDMVAENEPAREDSPRRPAWDRARAAIAKAEGKEG